MKFENIIRVFVGVGDVLSQNALAHKRERTVGWATGRAARSQKVLEALDSADDGSHVVLEGAYADQCLFEAADYVLGKFNPPKSVTIRLHHVESRYADRNPMHQAARDLAVKLDAVHQLDNRRLHVVPMPLWKKVTRQLIAHKKRTR